MTLALKVRRADSATPVLPRLADFADFVEARDKLRQIAAEFNAATAELTEIDKNIELLSRARECQIDEAARARLDGKPTQMREALVKSRQDIQLKVDVARRALMLQTDAFQAIKRKRTGEVIEQIRPVHSKLLAAVLDAAVALSSALEAEESLRIELAREDVVGINSTILTPVPIAIRKAVARQAWASPLNYLGRAVIGPEWHSTK